MWFACPLCSRRCQVRTTKKGKPYLTCDVCGFQMFVRYGAGIARLADRSWVETGRRSGTADPSGASLVKRDERSLHVHGGRSPETLRPDLVQVPKSRRNSSRSLGQQDSGDGADGPGGPQECGA